MFWGQKRGEGTAHTQQTVAQDDYDLAQDDQGGDQHLHESAQSFEHEPLQDAEWLIEQKQRVFEKDF